MFLPGEHDFGPLKVVNDELLKPGGAFPIHHHNDVEIFSYVLEGDMTNKDANGVSKRISEGSCYHVTCGEGTHFAEANLGEKVCRYIQVWLRPKYSKGTPSFGAIPLAKKNRHNCLLKVLGGMQDDPHGGLPRLYQDASIYISEIDCGIQCNVILGKGKLLFVLCVGGSTIARLRYLSCPTKAKVHDVERIQPLEDGEPPWGQSESLDTGDAVEIRSCDDANYGQVALESGESGAHLLIIEMMQT
ncbi:hypothetical protein CYMTET_16026 [Cymbomonas tetramitiformis]|uniref:Pirin N-terminal domain-containing protein n=1 Tax=Cymbomonas tetramitiformis TaxID=36881 RepID=A0AAE0GD06_9CHLO|nr:hypothetical protein CYMTET_16026 [Cymbomonas tetramitiformis]